MFWGKNVRGRGKKMFRANIRNGLNGLFERDQVHVLGFLEKEVAIIHPTRHSNLGWSTQKIQKRRRCSANFGEESKIGSFFFSAAQNAVTTIAKQMGGVSDDDDLLSVDDGHSSHHFSPRPSQSLAAMPASKSMRKSSPRKWKMTPLMGVPPTKATRSRLTAAEISAVTMEKIYWALASLLPLVLREFDLSSGIFWRDCCPWPASRS
jgi:hypothetical protein